MFGSIADVLFFIASAGFIVVALRARRNFRDFTAITALLGLIRAGEAAHAFSTVGNSPWHVLKLLSGIQFLIAAAFFIRAGTLRER